MKATLALFVTVYAFSAFAVDPSLTTFGGGKDGGRDGKRMGTGLVDRSGGAKGGEIREPSDCFDIFTESHTFAPAGFHLRDRIQQLLMNAKKHGCEGVKFEPLNGNPRVRRATFGKGSASFLLAHRLDRDRSRPDHLSFVDHAADSIEVTTLDGKAFEIRIVRTATEEERVGSCCKEKQTAIGKFVEWGRRSMIEHVDAKQANPDLYPGNRAYGKAATNEWHNSSTYYRIVNHVGEPQRSEKVGKETVKIPMVPDRVEILVYIPREREKALAILAKPPSAPGAPAARSE